jgi:mannose-6-phosphate isomerase
LLRWHQYSSDNQVRRAALRLIDLAERHGVDQRRNVALAAILTDGTVHDPQARLWSQTERVKAACCAAAITGDADYWRIATDATCAMRRYLEVPLLGLWRDKLNNDGSFVAEDAPASSFYHIVGALSVLRATATC